jgi:ABC-type dipeptide/oligopeptide/nickel transport system permease subunit
MKKAYSRNYPLWIGAALTGFFIFIAIIGPRLAPIDPMEVFDDVLTVGEKVYIPSRLPVPPLTLAQFFMGTDNAGRDLYSRLLWAIRPTLLLCFIIASLRIFLGTVLGLTAGWFGGLVTRIIDLLTDISLAIPILLFALAAISFMGSRGLSTFMVALVATGWANTAVFVKNSTLVIKQSPYIEGAKAVGVRPFGILRGYVLPQLWPALPALIAFELAATLLVLAELGFLGMFIGDAFVRMSEDPNSAGVMAVGLTAGYPELGQMLSDFWNKMLLTPWEVALIGLVIFLNIFAFNMLGEGLRRQMDVTRPRRRWRRK